MLILRKIHINNQDKAESNDKIRERMANARCAVIAQAFIHMIFVDFYYSTYIMSKKVKTSIKKFEKFLFFIL